ncbi:gag-pol polyprotein [Tanacetum coccineum]
MSTQQDIYVVGLENRPPMLNKDNYIPWSSHLLRYAKSKSDEKMLVKSILDGPYQYRMTEEPGDQDRTPHVLPSSHIQTDEQSKLRLMIRLFKLFSWKMMKGIDIGVMENEAKLLNELEKFTSVEGESIESYYHRFAKLMNLTPKNIACNLKFLNNLQPEWKRYVAIVNQTKKLHEVDYNQLYDYLKQNQDELVGIRMEMLLTVRAKNNGNGTNANQTRCYNCRGVGYYARNCTSRQRKRVVAYLQTQLLIAQKEESGIQLQAEKFDLMVVVADCKEIEEVNVNYILMENLQQAWTSGTHADAVLVYDSDGSAKVNQYEICYNNAIYNMFAYEEQYIELLESTTDTYLVQQDDSNVIPTNSSMDLVGGQVEQHPATIEETRALYESLYYNLVIEVVKVNTVNHDTPKKIVAWKFLNEVKDTTVTIQPVVKSKMSLNEILKETSNFVRDYKSLAKEADESLKKMKCLERENERLLRAAISQDIMSIVQAHSVIDTSNLQTEL